MLMTFNFIVSGGSGNFSREGGFDAEFVQRDALRGEGREDLKPAAVRAGQGNYPTSTQRVPGCPEGLRSPPPPPPGGYPGTRVPGLRTGGTRDRLAVNQGQAAAAQRCS